MDLINAGCDVIKTAVLQYKGEGYVIELFLLMLVGMFFFSKKHEIDRRLLIYTLISIIILCNPIVAVVLQKTALHSVLANIVDIADGNCYRIYYGLHD